MTDNVYYLSQHSQKAADDRDRADRSPRAAEEKLRARELKQLREIEADCGKKPKGGQLKWPLLDDRVRAASAVGELRNELLERGYRVATAKEIFPKLHRFIIESDQDQSNEVSNKSRGRELIGKVHPYLIAAQAIAKVANLDENEAKLRVLRQTTLWQNWRRGGAKNDHVPEADKAADEVSFLIERLSARIIRDEKLNELFARMRRVPGQWDIPTKSFRISGNPCLYGTAYQDWYDFWDDAPPLPSISLVRLRHARLSFPVHLSNQASSEPMVGQDLLEPVSSEEGEERPAELHVYREIRLALGPTVNAEALGPLFESRIYAELIVLDGDDNTLHQGPLDFGSSCNLESLDPGSSAAVRLDDRWHRFTPLEPISDAEVEDDLVQTKAALSGLHVDSPLMWDFTPLAENKQCMENHWISWTPVDAKYFDYWFSRLSEDRRQPIEFLIGVPRPTSLTWYPRTDLASFIEEAIYGGRLVAALRNEIAHIRQAFENYEIDWMSRMEEQTVEQIAAFDSDLIASHMPIDQNAEGAGDGENL
jgi:hypothetical protein